MFPHSLNRIGYMGHKYFHKTLFVVVIISLYIITSNFLSEAPISESHKGIKSYFDYITPKEQLLRELQNHPDYKKTGFNFQPLYPGSPCYNTKVLEKLKNLFPYDSKLAVPKQIWQMWKVGLGDEQFPQMFKIYHETWLRHSPEYTYSIKSNAEYDALVTELYADVPDIIHAYNLMPQTILKCDFSRYLILFAYGGIYADIDTVLLKPLSSWVPGSLLSNQPDLGLVVGIESDVTDWKKYFYARRLQINTWTIVAKKGHPMLAELINKITEYTLQREKAGKLHTIIGSEIDNILDWTGPGIFTDFLFKHLNNILQSDSKNHETIIDYELLTNIKLPLVIGDTMVMPVTCMNPGWPHLNSGKLTDQLAYIKHIGPYMGHRYFQKGLFAISAFVISYYVITFHSSNESPMFSPHPTPSPYFKYISPKEEFLREIENHSVYKRTGLNFQPSHPAPIPHNTYLLQQLNKFFPYDESLPMPKQVWQMWKVGLDDADFPEGFKNHHDTWVENSPEYEHFVKTNAECDDLVAEIYADIPEIVHAYNIMPKTILKCDFSRYLLLFAYGGIYADIDTTMLKPIRKWFSSKSVYLNETLNLGLVVGIEADVTNWRDYAYARRVQVNTWTIMAKKRHPMLAELIAGITEQTLMREKKDQLDTIFASASDNILNWTGPGIFTDYVFKHVNNMLQSSADRYEVLVDDEFLDSIKLPVVIRDTMILPVSCLNPGYDHLKSGNWESPLAYIGHQGSGTWKGDM
ncbi:Initiation-specific alpha-16-mannosyltransferase [Spathaspora sp. JA1]|nr:Initiation-specific alpha-16-mannosyltransferase [Spathaspora sp. JA1]